MKNVTARVDGDISGILWNDQRTAAQCQTITDRVGETRLIEITGNPALTEFQAPKILWLRDEEPNNYQRVKTVLLPKDYIRLKLTGLRAQGRDHLARARSAFPQAWSDHVDDFFSRAKVTKLKGAGHFVPVEAPQAFASAIKDAL